MKAQSKTTLSSRRSVNTSTRQAVLLEAGYKCANPSCRHVLTLELHHILWIKEGGSNDPLNLVALCPNCHSLHTAGHIPRQAIRTWKSLLMSLNNPHRASADLLLVLYDEEQRVAQSTSEDTPPFRFTGDGLSVLSGLLTAGLIEISRRFLGANFFGGGMPSFEVRLTLAGRQFVEAWRSGKSEEVQSALAYQRGTD
jgi:hypothetical protein